MRIVIAIITALLTISAGAAFILWNRVLQWAFDSLFPWVEVNIPTVAPIVREAFAILDNIGTPTRITVKQSWEQVRQYLLKQVLQFSEISSDTWVRRVISWLLPVLSNNEPVCQAKMVITEKDVDFYDEEMPPEVRQAFIRRQEKMTEFDLTKMRDEELAQDDDLTYEN
jgi:hypothetical protein